MQHLCFNEWIGKFPLLSIQYQYTFLFKSITELKQIETVTMEIGMPPNKIFNSKTICSVQHVSKTFVSFPMQKHAKWPNYVHFGER